MLFDVLDDSLKGGSRLLNQRRKYLVSCTRDVKLGHLSPLFLAGWLDISLGSDKFIESYSDRTNQRRITRARNENIRNRWYGKQRCTKNRFRCLIATELMLAS